MLWGELMEEIYWLNIDYPRCENVLHRPGCRHEATKAETPYKGVGVLKRDGGWIALAGKVAVDRFLKQLSFGAKLCDDCNK